MTSIATVRIGLLGGFAVSVGNDGIPEDAWRLRKAKALVKLLAMAPGHRLPWEQIGEALWPDRDAAAVRNNINQAVRAARQALTTAGLDGRRALRLQDGVLTFGDTVVVSVDVEEFTAAVEHGHAVRSPEAYQAAAALYTGELLPEDRYEDWADAPREALREQHSALLMEMARLHRARGNEPAAIDALRSLLRHHALYEPARRELMHLLAAAGRRQEALAEYETLRDGLRRSLEADPDPETRRLYRELLEGSLDGDGTETPSPDRNRTDNLPVAVSTFVGRDREVTEVERLLGATRLLTLTGVGGVGKTRLALEVARRRLGVDEHGVWLVDLAPWSDPQEVPQAVAGVLGLELPERGTPLPALLDQLAERRLLLLLDNCEHLVAACARLVAEILRSCPGVTVLATSREALRIEGETAWRVPSLALPDLNRLPEPVTLAHQGAVQLFCERATAVDAGFELTGGNARTVAELCVRLDGIPLAVELAAARVRMLAPGQILERLNQVLDMHEGDSRATLSRQRTLGATLDWSHDLLDAAERQVFRRLAVFAGSFPLEAAEHVGGVSPLAPQDVFPRLGRLVDKSLVVTDFHGDLARYRLLETVRQYAQDRLSSVGERAVVEQRHREWYRQWAEAHDPERAPPAGEEALEPFDVEHDNLRTALRSALADEPETALRLATSLWRFWLARGHFADGRRWLEAALSANPARTALRARGLLAVAVLDMRYATGHTRLQQVAGEVVGIHRGLGDDVALAQALQLTAVLLWTAHRWEEADQQLDVAAGMAEKLRAEHVRAAVNHTRGIIRLSRGLPAEAQSRFETTQGLLDSLDSPGAGFLPAISVGFSLEWDSPGSPRILFEETLVMGHRLDVGPAKAFVRYSQAWAARANGDLDTAIVHAEDSLAGSTAQGWAYGDALARNLLGNLHRAAGDFETARHHLERSLRLRTQLGDRRATGVTLGGLARLASAQGDAAGAQRYLGRALELFARTEDRFGEAGMLLDLGVVSLRAGEFETAQGHFEQVQQLRDAPGMRQASGWVDVMLAETATRLADSAVAAEHLARARASFEALGQRAGLEHLEHQRLTPAE